MLVPFLLLDKARKDQALFVDHAMAQGLSSGVVDQMWYHGISTHGRVAHVAIFLKQAKACRVMCHAGLCVWCAKPQKVENRLHGGADKCQLRHTHDGPRMEQSGYWLFSADCELCGCSVSMDNLKFTTRCRIMQRSQTKSVFSFLVIWSLLIFPMK